MNRNEITLQEMFSSVIGELRESGRWGTAHIYQSTVNAFSAFTKWQPTLTVQTSSPITEECLENSQAEERSWNTSPPTSRRYASGINAGGGQKVHTVCTQTV